MLYALIKYLFLRPLVNYFGQKTFCKSATSRLLLCEDIRRSDWLLVYLGPMRIFKFISFFIKIVKLFLNFVILFMLIKKYKMEKLKNIRQVARVLGTLFSSLAKTRRVYMTVYKHGKQFYIS